LRQIFAIAAQWLTLAIVSTSSGREPQAVGHDGEAADK
jgi:hypothetical protein